MCLISKAVAKEAVTTGFLLLLLNKIIPTLTLVEGTGLINYIRLTEKNFRLIGSIATTICRVHVPQRIRQIGSIKGLI